MKRALADPAPDASPLATGWSRGLQNETREERSGLDPSEQRNDFQFIYESTTLEELDWDLEIDLDTLLLVGDGEFEDTDRTEARLRYRRGNEIIGYYFDLGYSGFEIDNDFNVATDELDGFTFGSGAEGLFRFQPEEEISPLLMYGLGFAIGYAESDAKTVVVPGLSDPLVFESDLVYAQVAGELGAGVDLFGARLAAGAALVSMYGILATDVETTVEGLPIEFEEEFTFDGTNWGPFIQVGYWGDEVPLSANLRVLFGDYRGLVASIGVHF